MLITFHINREVRLTLTHQMDADRSSPFPFGFYEFYVIFCG